MRMTVSKRFEFAASHRYFDLNLSAPDNRKKYGQKSRGDHGHGHNYVAFLIFEGAVDGTTGMLVNISIIKERILGLLARRFDHKYLNVDSPPFYSILPTPENIARQMLVEAVPLFDDIPATPTAVYLEESNHTAACAFTDGRTERILRIDFSAARRTFSPHLNDDENEKLFGAASRPAGHGHHYYLWVTLESVSG